MKKQTRRDKVREWAASRLGISPQFKRALEGEINRLMEQTGSNLWKMDGAKWKKYKKTLALPSGKPDLNALTKAIKEREKQTEEVVLSKLRRGQWVNWPDLARMVPIDLGRLGGATRQLANKGRIEIRDAKMGPGEPQRPSAYRKR